MEVTTAMHAWTALLTSQANHSLAYKLSNLGLAYKLRNPPWRPIKGSPHPSFQHTAFGEEKSPKQEVVHLVDWGECEVRVLAKAKVKEQC